MKKLNSTKLGGLLHLSAHIAVAAFCVLISVGKAYSQPHITVINGGGGLSKSDPICCCHPVEYHLTPDPVNTGDVLQITTDPTNGTITSTETDGSGGLFITIQWNCDFISPFGITVNENTATGVPVFVNYQYPPA